MKTWIIKLQGRQVQVKALKADVERLSRAIGQAANVAQHWREIRGIIGGQEYESTLYSPFGGGEGKIADPEKYAADYLALVTSIPDLVTTDAIPSIIARAIAVYTEHLPIVDNHKSPEQEQERVEQVAQIEQGRKDQAEAFAREYCASLEPVTVPDGYMGVYIELSFDDSDGMSDYYRPHSQIGCDMLLGIVKKQAKRETIARDMVSRYPELAGLTWEWHTENYSMGEGNYLESNFWGEVDRKAYDGRDTVGVQWVIRFDPWAKSILPFRGYPGNVAQAEQSQSPQNSEAVTITHDRDWTWVKFSEKPAPEILTGLKSNGGRFSGKRQAWYFTRHVEAEELGLVGVPA